HVIRGRFEPPVPADAGRRRNADHLRSQCDGAHSRRDSNGDGQRLELLPRAHQESGRARGAQVSAGADRKGHDMKNQQMLAHQFDLVYRMIAENVAGMTAEQSLAQPSPGGNCANWILGHLTNVQNSVMKLVGEEPVWESDQLSRAGWEPITGQHKAI